MDPLTVDVDLPPAARHVAHALQEAGPCTQPELVELTRIPETTVDDALQRLVDEDLVEPRQRWHDARGRRYELVE